MKIFKYVLLLSVILLIAWFVQFSQAFAQSCGGSPSCTSRLYNADATRIDYCHHDTTNDASCSFPITDRFACYTCDLSTVTTVTGDGICRYMNGIRVCGACVTDDQECSPSGDYFDGFAWGTDLDGINDAGVHEYVYCAGYPNIFSVPNTSSDCPSNTDQKFCGSGCVTYCTSGTTSCNACGGGSEPTNTCGTTPGTQTCYHNAPGACTWRSFAQGCGPYTYNSCSNNYTCPGGATGHTACTTHINVHVYKDYNHDGVVNGADGGYQGISVTDGSGAQTTDSTGYTIFTGETTGTYTITITVPTNWHVLGSNPSKTVTLTNSSGNVDIDFWLTPLYSISGNLFNDNNHNANYDGGDTLYTGSTTVHIVGVSPVSDMTQTDGTYATSTSLESGTYTVSLTSSLPSGYTMTTTKSWTVVVGNPTGSPVCAVGGSPDATCGGTNNGSINALNFGINPPYQISGNLFIDANHNKNYDAGDSLYTGSTTVHITGPSAVPDMTQTDGTYSTGQVLLPGTYTVTLTSSLPTGYSMTTTTSWTVTVGYSPACAIGGSPDATCGNPNGGSVNNLNFGINPPYQISGRVYNDVNKNGQYDAGVDQPITTGPSIQVTGPTNKTVTASTSDGTYSTGQVLLPGTYAVKYKTALDPGWSFQDKISSYAVVVGYNPPCNVGGSKEASCGNPNAGSVNNLNFDLTNENTQPPQPICGDLRLDAGYSGFIPSTESCNGTSAPYAIVQNSTICPNIPGVLYSGGTDPSYGTGSGPSATGQQVGNFGFPELFHFPLPQTSQTSYSFVTTTITNNALTAPTNLTSICPNLTNCVLSETTPGGIYETAAADGPVKLSVSNGDGSFNLGAHNYVFLIGDDLTFASNLLTPTGYTATFIAAGDMHVASNVGESSWTATSPDLEGVLSADGNFILDTATSANNLCQFNGQPIDKKLNILGSVITNAGGRGGSVENEREGCLQDLSCPGVTIQQDPVLLLQLIGGSGGITSNPNSILKPPYSFWQELNP